MTPSSPESGSASSGSAFSGRRGRRRLLAGGAALCLARLTSAADQPREHAARPAQLPPMPGYLERVRDPYSGLSITRISGEPGAQVPGQRQRWGTPTRHAYSTVAAWDASDGLLALRSAGATKADGSGAYEWLLLDGARFEPLGAIERRFDAFRWWHTRARRLLLIDAGTLHDVDPLSGERRPLALGEALAGRFDNLRLANEANLSRDDATLVLMGEHRGSGVLHALVCDLAGDRLIASFALDQPRVDFATISPSGRYVVVNGETAPGDADRTRVYDLHGEPVGPRWDPYGTPSHYDLTLDADGRDIAVGVAKTATGEVPAGAVISRRLDTGQITVLLQGGYATHTSCRNVASAGHAFVSYLGRFPERYPPFGDELLSVSLDGRGTLQRVCQLPHGGDDYWAQAHACPDTAGRRALFASNWADPEGPVHAFVVQLEPEPDPDRSEG